MGEVHSAELAIIIPYPTQVEFYLFIYSKQPRSLDLAYSILQERTEDDLIVAIFRAWHK